MDQLLLGLCRMGMGFLAVEEVASGLSWPDWRVLNAPVLR